jgi:hypothetical protein
MKSDQNVVVLSYDTFAGQVGCEAYAAVALFLLSAGLNTFTVPGCKTSMLDMAPAYSGDPCTMCTPKLWEF